MGPSDYQGQAAQNQQAAGGQRLPSFAPEAGTIAQAISKVPSGDLTRILEALVRFHSRINEDRDRLVNFNERAGVRHTPTAADTPPPSTAAQAEGVLPAIESNLQLIHESLQQLEYQITRIEQL